MPDEFVTKDSGAREEFATGSKRDTREGKGRFDLIPTMPLRRLAGLYERGAAKYGDYNWCKGQPLQRYIDSAMRHLNCLVAGEPTEDHAIAAVWNLFAYVWTLNEIEAGRLPRALDDRPPPEPQYVPKESVEAPKESVDQEAQDHVPVGPWLVFVGAWRKGGCAWCGDGAGRDNRAYMHDHCLTALHEHADSDVFDKFAAACKANK